MTNTEILAVRDRAKACVVFESLVRLCDIALGAALTDDEVRRGLRYAPYVRELIAEGAKELF